MLLLAMSFQKLRSRTTPEPPENKAPLFLPLHKPARMTLPTVIYCHLPPKRCPPSGFSTKPKQTSKLIKWVSKGLSALTPNAFRDPSVTTYPLGFPSVRFTSCQAHPSLHFSHARWIILEPVPWRSREMQDWSGTREAWSRCPSTSAHTIRLRRGHAELTYTQGNGGRDKPPHLGFQRASASDCASEKATAASLFRLVSLGLRFCCHCFQEALLTSLVPPGPPGALHRCLGSLREDWATQEMGGFSELGSPASTPDFESDWSGSISSCAPHASDLTS